MYRPVLPPPHCAVPAIRHVPLAPGRHYTLVVASDGLWDVVKPSELADIVRGAAGSGPSAAAAALRDEAFVRGVTDNVTVGLMRLYQAE